jgi:urease accessory protein UreF
METANPVDRNATIVTDYPGTGGGSGLPAGTYAYPQTYERNAVQQGGVNPATAAQNYVLGNMQGEADSHSINGYVSAFESLLKGGGG